MEDRRAECLGGINTALLVFQQSILPTLWHNAETWINTSKKSMRIISGLYSSFFQTIFRIGSGTPQPNFYWQTAMLLPQYFLLQKKLGFLYHLVNLPEDSLGRKVIDLEAGKKLEGGLVTEMEEEIKEMGISQLSELRSISKWRWKTTVKKFVLKKNQESLLESIQKYKKLDYHQMSQESFERKSYLSNMKLEDSRMLFRISSQMLDLKVNMKNKYRNQSLTCRLCRSDDPESVQAEEKPEESQFHLANECETFSSLRSETDFSEYPTNPVF